jgi:hypothetical protein
MSDIACQTCDEQASNNHIKFAPLGRDHGFLLATARSGDPARLKSLDAKNVGIERLSSHVDLHSDRGVAIAEPAGDRIGGGPV